MDFRGFPHTVQVDPASGGVAVTFTAPPEGKDALKASFPRLDSARVLFETVEQYEAMVKTGRIHDFTVILTPPVQ